MFCFVFRAKAQRSLPWLTSNSSSGFITKELPLSWRVSGADGKLQRSNAINVRDRWLVAGWWKNKDKLTKRVCDSRTSQISAQQYNAKNSTFLC